MSRSRAPDNESSSYGKKYRAALWALSGRVRSMFRRTRIRPQNAQVFAAIVFLGFIVVVAATHLARERVRALETASRDIALCASDLARRVDSAILAQASVRLEDALQQAVFDGPNLTCGVAVLLEASGLVVASHPAKLAKGVTLADWLGPHADLPEASGAREIETSAGELVLAARRTLKAASAQVAMYQTVDEALDEWRSRVALVSALVIALAGVLVGAVTYAKLQTQRAAFRAFRHSTRLARTEVALSRGRSGLWDWDLDNGDVTWSQSMFEILGLGHRPRLIIDEIDALVHPEDAPLAALVTQASQTGDGSIDVEFRMRGRDGQWIWLRQRAEILFDPTLGCRRLVGVALDVTERKREAESLAAADQRLREAIEAISEAFVLWDASNRLVLCNSKYQRLHSLPPEAVRPGASYADLAALGSPPEVSSETPLSPHEAALGVERARTFVARLADGRWLQVNERRTRDGGFVSVGTDISALKEQQDELVKSRETLMANVARLRLSQRVLEEQAQQLSALAAGYQEQKVAAEAANLAKAEFLANMGHELRTPLNHIIGFSEMMGGEFHGPLGCDRYREYCSDISFSGQELLRLVDAVLDMASLEAGRAQLEYSHFEVAAAIDEATLDVAQTVLDRRIGMSVEVGYGETIEADRAAFVRIVTTLLRNAVKYAPEGGTVAVGAQSLKGMLYVYVEDDGPGIAEEELERLGRPFVQGRVKMDNGMKGSGLGLAIAKSFVDLHGGELRLSADPGKGTVALVTMPQTAPHGRMATIAAE